MGALRPVEFVAHRAIRGVDIEPNATSDDVEDPAPPIGSALWHICHTA